MRLKIVLSGLIVGVLLLYTGIMGSQGYSPLLSFTGTTLPCHEDFNDLVGWEVAYTSPTINPSGQALFTTTSTNDRSSMTCANPGAAVKGVSQYTITMKMQAQWGGGVMGIQMYDDSYYFFITFSGSSIKGTGATQDYSWPVTIDNAWHVYTILVSVSGVLASEDVYFDMQKMGTANSKDYSANAGLRRVSLDAMGGAAVHMDYIYFDSGLNPPGTTPPPTDTGSLKVYAKKDGASVDTSVSISGPESKVQTTSGGQTIFTVKVGSYTVSATYAGQSRDQTAQVNKDQMAEATLDFSSGTPPPTKCSLTVTAYSGGQLVAASVTVTGADSRSGTSSTDPGSPLMWNDLNPGTYSVSGTYNGMTASGSTTIAVGQSGAVALTFQGGPGPIDPWQQVRLFITRILNNSNVQMLFDAVGAVLVVVGLIALFLPAKKRQESQAPSPKTIIL